MDHLYGLGSQTPVMDWVHAPLKKIKEGEMNNKHNAK